MLSRLVHPLELFATTQRLVDDTWRAMRRSLFWTLLMRQRRWIKWLLALWLTQILLTIQIGNVTVRMVDDAIVDQAVPLTPYLVHIVWLATVVCVVGFIVRQMTARIGYQLEFELRTWLYTRVQSAEMRELDNLAAGQLVTRSITDLTLVEEILRFLPIVLGLFPIVMGLFVFLLILNPVIALLSVAALPVNLWLLTRFRTRLWGLSWAELNERAEVATAVDEPVRGIRVVKAFGREEFERARVRQAAERAYRYAMTRIRLVARYDILIKLAPTAVNSAVLFLGARFVVDGQMTLGVFVIAFQVATGINQIAQVLDELASGWQYLRGAQGRLAEVLAHGRRPREGRPLADAPTGLELLGVRISFDGRPVLDGFDLEVAAGELVVLNGPPRSGKSTVGAVASGLLAPHAGSVRLDGIDLGLLDGTALRTAVRVVSEEPVLFSGTIRENLDLGVPWRAGDEELTAALRAAGAEDVVGDRPKGLDATVGDRGLTLSGGQRQRIALARALVSPPRVLVLDDALSAVNPALEVEILRRIRAHAPATAILCATRREGPTRLADRVVRLPDPHVATTAARDDSADARERGVPAGGLNAATGPADARLARIVDELQLTEGAPPVDDATVGIDARPRIRLLLSAVMGTVLLTSVVLLVSTGANLAPEYLFGPITDAIEQNDTRTTDRRALLALALSVVYVLSYYSFRILLQRVTQTIVYLLRRRIFARLTNLGVDYYDRELPGHVAARVVNDLDTVLNFLSRHAPRFATSIALVVVSMGIFLTISPGSTLVVALLVASLVLAMAIQFPISTRAYNHARTQLGHVVAKFEEDFAGRDEIKSFGASAKANRRFVEAAWELRRARRWSLGVANAYFEVVEFITLAGTALVLWQAGHEVLAGAVSIGSALSLRLVSYTALQRLARDGDAYTRLLEVRVSWQRLQEPFDAPILPVERPDAVDCPTLRGEVEFDSVHFRYPRTDRPVLHGVSFHVGAGTTTALVGYTGAGKSSIAKLLARMYDPDQGVVRVDGLDLRTVRLHAYRRRLGIVPQEAFVFRGSVASNIAYSRPDATPEEIEAAARAMGAYGDLASLDGGFAHPVEEEGRNLTAAQRQLIALARAYLAEPDILVLDEATSSLDGPLEERVLDAVRTLGCTTLMITHRDNVARRADRVIVLSAGRVVEEGTPDELIGAGGAYDRLWLADDAEVAGRRRGRRSRVDIGVSPTTAGGAGP